MLKLHLKTTFEVMFIRAFYIVTYLYLSQNCIYCSVICKDSSGCN